MPQRQIITVFAALMLGTFLAAIDQTAVSTALPSIAGEFGQINQMTWVITAYLLTSTVAALVFGKLGDLYGRKKVLVATIVIFIGGSLLAGLTQNMTQLIFVRGIQGLGAGGTQMTALALIGDIVSPRERGRYQGFTSSMWTAAFILGPLMGGLLTDNASWRLIFFTNAILGATALIGVLVFLRLPHKPRKVRLDYAGTVLFITGVSSLLLLATWGGSRFPWTSPVILGLGALAAIAVPAFLVWEKFAAEPLLPLRLFRDRVFNTAIMVMAVISMVTVGATTFMPLYFQVVRAEMATSSGLKMLPVQVGLMITSILSGRLISHTGHYRIFPILGTGIMAFGVFLLSSLGASTNMTLVLLYMLILGFGLGMLMQTFIVAVQNKASYEDLGVATAGVNLFRQLGATFGVALFGAFLANNLNRFLQQTVSSDAVSTVGRGALTASPQQLRELPEAVHAGVVQAFSQSLHLVFLVLVPIAIAAFIVSWFVPEVPLRRTVHQSSGDKGSVPQVEKPTPARAQ